MKLFILIMLMFQGNVNWEDSIHNPENEEFVVEVAFNLDIPVGSVTQEQFNDRYLPAQELIIDVIQDIDTCEISLIVDDIYYPVNTAKVNGSTITLQLTDYQDYMIVINNNEYISISTSGVEYTDEYDLSISSDVGYQFEEGVLVFNFTKTQTQ